MTLNEHLDHLQDLINRTRSMVSHDRLNSEIDCSMSVGIYIHVDDVYSREELFRCVNCMPMVQIADMVSVGGYPHVEIVKSRYGA